MVTTLGGPHRSGLPTRWLTVCAEQPVLLQPRSIACVQGRLQWHSVTVLSFTPVPTGRPASARACCVRLGCMFGRLRADLPWLHGSPEACLRLCRSAHKLALLRDQGSLGRHSSAVEQSQVLALSSLSRELSRQVSPAVQRGAASGQDRGPGAAPGAALAEEAGAQPAAGGHLVSLDDVWVNILTQGDTPQVPFLPGIIKRRLKTCSWAWL